MSTDQHWLGNFTKHYVSIILYHFIYKDNNKITEHNRCNGISQEQQLTLEARISKVNAIVDWNNFETIRMKIQTWFLCECYSTVQSLYKI